MDFTALLQKIDTASFENQSVFADKKNNDISGIMYFDDEEYTQNANFLDDNDTVPLYEIRNKALRKMRNYCEKYNLEKVLEI